MPQATQRGRTNQIVTQEQHQPCPTIDADFVGTVKNIAIVQMDMCPIRKSRVDKVIVRILQTVITIITGEIDTTGIDIAVASPHLIGAEVTEMTITEITPAIEIGVITTTTTEAVQEVAVEAEKGGERVDVIVRTGLVEIDLGIGMRRVEIGIDLERDTETDLGLDLETDLVTDPGTGPEIEIVLDLATDLEIEKDLVKEEKDTVKTIDRVDVVAKVRTKEIMTA